jgi:hypothetical protein
MADVDIVNNSTAWPHIHKERLHARENTSFTVRTSDEEQASIHLARSMHEGWRV